MSSSCKLDIRPPSCLRSRPLSVATICPIRLRLRTFGRHCGIDSPADGPLRVPGQGALRAVRHSRLGGPARGDPGGGPRRGRDARPARSSSRPRCSPADAARRAGSSSRRRPDEAAAAAEAILGLDINGHVVEKLWIERASDIANEYYLSVTFDRGEKKPLFMLTSEGGIDIEEVAENTPDALAQLHVDPLVGFQPLPGALALLPRRASPIRASRSRCSRSSRSSTEAFVDCDAMLCEINPLIVTPDGEVRALDSKFTVDDNALYRHPGHRRDARPRGLSGRGARGAREGRHLREARRRGRDPRERRRARHVHARRDRAGRREARELLRPGRRRRRAGRRGRARDHHRRPPGAIDPLQHLRRDHPLRRGGARDPRCARAARPEQPIVVRLDGTNAEEGRRLLAEAAPPNLYVEATMLDGGQEGAWSVS